MYCKLVVFLKLHVLYRYVSYTRYSTCNVVTIAMFVSRRVYNVYNVTCTLVATVLMYSY